MWCEGVVRRQSAQGPAGGPAWAGRRRPSTGIWVGGSSLLKKLELTPLLGWIQQPQMLMNLGQRHKPRGTGYSTNNWCSDLIAILSVEHPQGHVNVATYSEDQKNTCWPGNCPQYLYHCTVHVQA